MRPQIYEATTELGENTFRNQQEVPQGIPQEIPQEQENSEKQPDHTFKVIKTLNLIDQYTKKLTSQVTDAYCQDIAEIAKVKDTIEESDLLKNTKSYKKYKIAIDESALQLRTRI